MVPRVKVCCIKNRAEADLAIRHGASALGLVGPMPSGPGPIPESTISEIASEVPPPIATFLLTCEVQADAIIEQHGRCGTNTIQLTDYVDVPVYADLRRAMPLVKLVQVIHVTGEESLEIAQQAAAHVDALLLDSGQPDKAVKVLGGTGNTHDWSLSRRIVEASTVPVFLAGGLRPDNVAEAIRTVRPFGIDLCTGVRTNGDLDEVKLRDFFAAVREA